MEISALTNLITAFRAETRQDSITPETLGSLLQRIVNVLGGATDSGDFQLVEDAVEVISAIGNVLIGLSLGADDRNNIYVIVDRKNISTGVWTGQQLIIRPATTERAGAMKAQQVTDLNTCRNNFQKLARLTFTATPSATAVTLALVDSSGDIFNSEDNVKLSLPLASASQAGIISAADYKKMSALLQETVIDVKINSNVRYSYNGGIWLPMGVAYDADSDLYLHVFTKGNTCVSVKLPVATMKEVTLPSLYGQQATTATVGTTGLMSGEDKAALDKAVADIATQGKEIQEIQDEIVSIKTKGSGSSDSSAQVSSHPYYHIECNAKADKLFLSYPKELTEQGYVPYFLRYTVKRSRYRPDKGSARSYGPKMRGWHLFEDAAKIKLTDGGQVLIGRKIKSGKIFKQEYSDNKRFLFNSINPIESKMTGEVQGISIGYGYRTHKFDTSRRFRFGIVFAPPISSKEPTLNLSKVVTNIAEFQVHVRYEPELEYYAAFDYSL